MECEYGLYNEEKRRERKKKNKSRGSCVSVNDPAAAYRLSLPVNERRRDPSTSFFSLSLLHHRCLWETGLEGGVGSILDPTYFSISFSGICCCVLNVGRRCVIYF